MLVAASYRYDIIPRLLVPMSRQGITGRIVPNCVSVRSRFHPCASVSKIPYFLSVLCSERPHFEGHLIARIQTERGIVIRVDSGGYAVGMLAVDYINNRKIVSEIPGRVRYFHNLAVFTCSFIDPFDITARGFGAVAECPFILGNLPRPAPALRSIKLDRLTCIDQMVRSGRCNNLRAVLLLVRLPDEGVSVLSAPHARGLTALDIEMQMRPAAAAAFFADQADALPHLHAFAGNNRRRNHLKMAVAIVPAPVIENINHIIAWCDRRVLVPIEYVSGC